MRKESHETATIVLSRGYMEPRGSFLFRTVSCAMLLARCTDTLFHATAIFESSNLPRFNGFGEEGTRQDLLADTVYLLCYEIVE